MVKKRAMILIILIILIFITGLYIKNLFSELDNESQKKNLIRSSNPPVPENVKVGGGMVLPDIPPSP